MSPPPSDEDDDAVEVGDVPDGPEEEVPWDDSDERKNVSFSIGSLRHKRENVRGWLAKSLVLIFAAEILVSLFALIVCANSVENIKGLLSVILGPTVALVGSATGFYFGLKESDEHVPR
jgi:hypothetical protein